MGYLVISRKIAERIVILNTNNNEEIEILISDIDKKRVSVAIKAPKEYKIDRKATHFEEEKLNVHPRTV